MASAAAVTPLGSLQLRPLQHWLHSQLPRWAMAPRYTSSKHHSPVLPLPQPLGGPCLSTGRSAPRTSVLAYCCHNSDKCSPAISSSGVTRSSSHCVLSTSRGSSIVQPTCSHDSLADLESIRGSSSELVCFPRVLPTASCIFT